MPRLKTVAFFVASGAVAGGIVFATYAAADHYLTLSQDAPCTGTHAGHSVTISHNSVSPSHIQAARCDTLTISNQDDKVREMAFGQHDHHITYDGVTEKALRQGQSFTVTLNRPGALTFHDHLQDDVQGEVTVAN